MNALKINTHDALVAQETRGLPASASSAIPIGAARLPLDGEDRFRGQPLNLIPETLPEKARYLDNTESQRVEHDIRSPRSPQSATSSHFRANQLDGSLSGSTGHNTLNELGRGVPLRSIPPICPLYIVEFKAGRTDLFYSTDASLPIAIGDHVIVEADRGRDMGTVINDTITAAQVEDWQQSVPQFSGEGPAGTPESTTSKQLNPKRIYSKASSKDTQLLVAKGQDEEKALQLCQSKVQQKRLPMEVIDAEYQWDRRKLTFYFIAEKRIDFRELVRELFRLYKTRIWMASLSQAASVEV